MSRRSAYLISGTAIIAFALILAYASYQLFAIRRALPSFTGEDMLWNIMQTTREVGRLSDSVIFPDEGDTSENVDLRLSLLQSRLKIFSDNPQHEFYARIDGTRHLVALNRIIDEFQVARSNPATKPYQLYKILTPAFIELGQLSNKTILAQREKTGAQLDKQLHTIYLILTSIIGLLLSGFAMAWLLIANLRALYAAQKQLHDYNDKLESTIERRTAELQQSLINERNTNSVYKNFLATVSHQFRTPIAIIDMIAQRFVRRPEEITPDVLLERTLRIRSAVKQLTFIMDSTISNDRLTEGGFDLAVTEVDFNKIVEKVRAYHQDIYPERQIHCSASHEHMMIQGDAALIEQILLNFISNAEKYSPPSASIDVSVECDGTQLTCAVTDYGIGISEEDRPLIFDRFFRSKTVSHVEGSGLGLPLSLKLAQMHDGTITYRSGDGGGSIFELHLPVNGGCHD
ncbi:MAG: HAMP domain-containing histidine kinase [Brucellaceae bacterium]|jgi:signal transduction histidine kinase|nr:HAMP domain-containing histidine kinase [Brucellaceae bacterium]